MAVNEYGWGSPEPAEVPPAVDGPLEDTIPYQQINVVVNQLMDMDDVDPVDIIMALNAQAGELAAFVIDYLEDRI